jgi:hypothetical protein
MKNETSNKTANTPEKERVVIKGFAGKEEPGRTIQKNNTQKSPAPKNATSRQENPLKKTTEHEGNTEWDKPEEQNDPDHTQTDDGKSKRKI